MRKIFTVLSLSAITMGTVFTSCSSSGNRDEQVQEKQDFTNANYIKGLMLGKWKYFSHESSPGIWIETVYNSYFIFNSDDTYTFKSITSEELQNGTYKIYGATSTTDAVLILKYTDKFGNHERSIKLKALNGNVVTIYESTWNERYIKQ